MGEGDVLLPPSLATCDRWESWSQGQESERTSPALQQLPHTGELTPPHTHTHITAAAVRIKGPALLLGKQ